MQRPIHQRPHIVLMTKHNDNNTKKAADKLDISLIGKSVSDEKLINYLSLIHEDGARISNSNPKAPPVPERTQGLNLVIQELLTAQQIKIATMTRDGYSATEIQAQLKLKRHVVENEKTRIFNTLRQLMANGRMNIAVLSAVMERSGLCEPLALNSWEQVFKEMKGKRR